VTDVVYYLRRNDLIKIGWSGNLKARMRALRPDELLAVEPGCMHIETGRHHQFAEYRLPSGPDGDEWFRPAPELTAHIELIARMYPTPDLADLMPRPDDHRGPQRRFLAVALPVPTEELAALERFQDLLGCDLDIMTSEELIAAMRDCEIVRKASPGWAGRSVAALRNRGHSWAELVGMTGSPQTSLINRVRPFLAAASEGASA
jgi:hypothetical protein